MKDSKFKKIWRILFNKEANVASVQINKFEEELQVGITYNNRFSDLATKLEYIIPKLICCNDSQEVIYILPNKTILTTSAEDHYAMEYKSKEFEKLSNEI